MFKASTFHLEGANAKKGSISQLKREKVQKYKRNESQGGGKDRKNGGSIPNPVFFLMIVYIIFWKIPIIFLIFSLKILFFFQKIPFFLKKKTFKSQKFVTEEKKSENNRKKWGKDPEKKPNNSIANEIFGLNDNIEAFSNRQEELIVPEEDDASLVNCIDSLDMESVNFLRESMRLVLKKPEKIEKIAKNDEIEEIWKSFLKIQGVGKEENEEIQEGNI